MRNTYRWRRKAAALLVLAALPAAAEKTYGSDLPVISISYGDQEDSVFALWDGREAKADEEDDGAALGQLWKPAELPEKYDSRDDGKCPVIKSQGTLGTCWAITVTSALEAAWMPERHIVYSADHLSLNNGFQIAQSEGGDYMMAMAYLSGWRGPVLESEDPYGDGVSPDGLQAKAHVQEIQLLSGMSLEEEKEMIYRYGPVQTSLYMDRKSTSPKLDYYNADNCAYYYPEKRTLNHDILILGWDDTFPKENFKLTPSRDGAFICQNTWGTDFGEEGIFYVSYEDVNIRKGGVAYTKVEAVDNYDMIYQTDVCGWQGRQGYEEESCFFANVYTAKEKEQLEAVGFYVTGRDSRYEVYTVDDFEDMASFEERELRRSGFIANSGYYTIPLGEPVNLMKGERFAVIVKIVTPGAEKPVVVELKKDIYSEGVTLEGKEGYLSLTGETWEMTEEKFGTNVCLKAYTSRRE